MTNRRVLAALFVPFAACSSRVDTTPALFPMSQVWVAPLDDQAQALATDGRQVFAASRDGSLRAIDVASGELRWRVAARAGLLAAREGLVVSREPDGTVWAIDPATGSARWKSESGVAGALAPVLDGDRVVVAGEGLAVLDAAQGEAVWRVPPDAVATAAPVPAGPCLLVSEQPGVLRCREPGTGSSLWTWAAGGPILARPVVDDEGRILLGTTSRSFVALGLEDGQRKWRWRLGADVRTGAAILGQRVLFASHEAVLYALRRGGGNLDWRATIPSRPLGAPLLLGDGVIVACYGSRPDENLLLGFDGRSGRRLGEMRTPAEIEGEPLLVGDRLVMALRDRRLIGLQLAAPVEAEPSPSVPPVP